MSRLIAVEWDSREARVAAGRTSGRELVVETLLTVDLQPAGEESPQNAAARLAAALSERGLGRGDWLVAVPRGRAELRMLQTPPVPDAELPDLVRFQALRQFSSLPEDCPLDFVRVDNGQRPQLRVLAATISPAVLAEIHGYASACHATPLRVGLRPFASASLVGQHLQDGRCRLLIELLPGEADLNVLVDGQPVLVRSIRLPIEEFLAPLVAEIRRTIASAQNQIGEQSIQVVTLIGTPAEFPTLQESLAEQLGLEVGVFDPLSAVQLGQEAQKHPPRYPGRFTALLGMLSDQAEGRAPAIDFLNPRRRPQTGSSRYRFAALAASLAACMALLGGLGWAYLRGYDADIAALRMQSREMDTQVKMAQQLTRDVAEIDKFVIGDVNWLDELYQLSEKFPPSEDALITQASFTTIPSGGGQILLDGYVREPGVIRQMEVALRSERHQVTGSGAQLDERRQQHPWEFKEKVVILPPDLAELPGADSEQLPPDPAAKSAGEANGSAASEASAEQVRATTTGTPAAEEAADTAEENAPAAAAAPIDPQEGDLPAAGAEPSGDAATAPGDSDTTSGDEAAEDTASDEESENDEA